MGKLQSQLVEDISLCSLYYALFYYKNKELVIAYNQSLINTS